MVFFQFNHGNNKIYHRFLRGKIITKIAAESKNNADSSIAKSGKNSNVTKKNRYLLYWGKDLKPHLFYRPEKILSKYEKKPISHKNVTKVSKIREDKIYFIGLKD